MCSRCVEIDAQTARHRALAKSVTDEGALESIARLIESLIAEQLTLHSRAEGVDSRNEKPRPEGTGARSQPR